MMWNNSELEDQCNNFLLFELQFAIKITFIQKNHKKPENWAFHKIPVKTYGPAYLILIASISILLMKIWWALKNIFLVNI